MMIDKRLGLYSIFTVAVLNQSKSKLIPQVIYEDIDPDIILSEDYETAFINLDANAEVDFYFLKTSGYWYTFYLLETYFLHHDFVGAFQEENLIAANMVTHSAAGGTSFFPYKLEAEVLIDESYFPFYNAIWQQLASMVITDLGWLNIGIGEFANDSTEGYIGVKFIDESECYHYGWIRLEIDNACRSIIIKDYAYETECDYPILAGSKEHYVGMTELPVEDIQIYASNNQVFVNFQNGFLAESFISIYNTSAEKIYGAVLNASENIITLDHPPGMYVVEVRDKRSSTVKTILLQ